MGQNKDLALHSASLFLSPPLPRRLLLLLFLFSPNLPLPRSIFPEWLGNLSAEFCRRELALTAPE